MPKPSADAVAARWFRLTGAVCEAVPGVGRPERLGAARLALACGPYSRNFSTSVTGTVLVSRAVATRTTA